MDYMSFENTIYALNEYLDKTKDFLRVIGEGDDKMYEAYISLRD